MKSREKNARIVWRMKSVEVTRVMPSRCAASVASVDLPVPVAPPTSRTIGSSRCWSACRRRRRRIVRVPPRARRARSTASSASRSRSSRAAPRCSRSSVGAPRELVRARRRQPRRRQRARHEPLRPRRPVVAAERERCQVAALAHALTAAAAVASAASRSSARVEVGLAWERHDVVRGEDDPDAAALRLARRRRRPRRP